MSEKRTYRTTVRPGKIVVLSVVDSVNGFEPGEYRVAVEKIERRPRPLIFPGMKWPVCPGCGINSLHATGCPLREITEWGTPVAVEIQYEEAEG